MKFFDFTEKWDPFGQGGNGIHPSRQKQGAQDDKTLSCHAGRSEASMQSVGNYSLGQRSCGRFACARFVVGGIDNDMAPHAVAVALGAKVGLIAQRKVHNAPLAG